MAPAINPPELGRPSGFSYAYDARGERSVYFAGHTALDPQGKIVGPGDILRQFEQALSNLRATAAAAGLEMTGLIKLTLYVTDVEAYKARAAEIGAVYRRYFGRHYPAMTLVGVSRLWEPEAMIEIEAVAVG
jgi:enamine deaminase RidA (YjgF/YER057c/UK114 family)